MKIAIGADRSGMPIKDEIKKYLIEQGHEVDDFGMQDPEVFKPYYEVAPIVAEKISNGEYEKAILCCGTGAGMNIIANKFKGVYCVTVEGSYTAKMAAIINQANIISMGGWVIAPQQAFDMVDRWLNTGFTEGFEEKADFLCGAYNQVKEIENKNFK